MGIVTKTLRLQVYNHGSVPLPPGSSYIFVDLQKHHFLLVFDKIHP